MWAHRSQTNLIRTENSESLLASDPRYTRECAIDIRERSRRLLAGRPDTRRVALIRSERHHFSDDGVVRG